MPAGFQLSPNRIMRATVKNNKKTKKATGVVLPHSKTCMRGEAKGKRPKLAASVGESVATRKAVLVLLVLLYWFLFHNYEILCQQDEPSLEGSSGMSVLNFGIAFRLTLATNASKSVRTLLAVLITYRCHYQVSTRANTYGLRRTPPLIAETHVSRTDRHRHAYRSLLNQSPATRTR